MTEEKRNLLGKVHQDFFDVMMKDYDHNRLQNYVVDDVMGYGTTVDEKIFGLKGLQELVMLQKEQAKDADLQYTVTPVQCIITNDETVAIYTDEIEVSMQLDEGKNEFTVRISTILEFQNGTWKIVHWHGSKPVESEGDTWHKEEWKQLNERLQKQVDEKTADLNKKNWELEIEAALERVRTVAMGMQKPDDILDVCKIISEQLEKLSISNIRNTQVAIVDEQNKTYLNYQYFAPYAKKVFEETEYENNPTSMEMVVELRKSANSFFTGSMKGKELEKFIGWRKKYKQFPDPKLDNSSEVFYYFYSIGNGGLGLTTYNMIPKSGIDIFKRFHLVFKLAYQRYIDIEKAKAQAREAEIELALERIRARTMAMRSSDELREVVVSIYEQLQSLKFDSDACNIIIYEKETGDSLYWVSGFTQELYPLSYKIPFVDHKYYKTQISDWENGNSYSELKYSGKTKKEFDKIWFSQTDFRNVPKKPKAFMMGLKSVITSTAYMKYGAIQALGSTPLSDENAKILQRFSKVFEQTYTRFLDLQKAEAQAREAQIEAALERVRSRSMAMHKSEELADLSLELVKQVQALGVATWFCAFNIYDEDPNGSLEWGSNGEGTFPRYRTPREGVFLRYYEEGQKGETLFINEIGEDKCAAHYDYLCSLPGVGEQLLKMKEAGVPFPTSQIDHVAFFKYGYILFITFEPAPEAHDIFKRFAKVFEQTYTRFLDLQKAEAQAREAEIELALERVRARTMAMQKGEELKEVVVMLYKELIALGLTNFVTCGYVEINEETGRQSTWVTSPGGDSLGLFYLPLTGDAYFDERYAAWKQQQIVFHQTVAGENRRKHLEYAITTFQSKEAEEMVLGQFPDPCVFYCFNFSHGYLHIVTGSQLKKEEESLLARFTRVFEQTYARFLDLQKAEAQAREAQIEAALERVRSRSMAMHNSEEIKDVIKVIFDQMHHLNINAEHAGIVVDYKPKKDFHFWVADTQDIPSKISVPYLDLVWDKQFTEAKKKGIEFFTTHLDFEEKNSFYKDLLPHIQGLTKKAQDFYFSCPGLSASTVIEKDIGLYIENFSGTPYSDEENAILMRFGKVFQQTYTRFLDLQKAEAQVREALIEASLERVRSRSIGMQKSEELSEVIQVIHDQLIHLEFKIDAAGFTMDYFQNNDWNVWIANKNQSLPTQIYIPYTDHPQFNYYKEAKEKGLEFFSNTLSFDDKNSIFNYMFDFMGEYPEDEKALVLDAPGFAISQAFLKNITLWIYNLEGKPYSEEDNAILMRFAKVFEQTYVRFNDLKHAEAQAKEAQTELSLERIRAQVTAMNESSDLLDIVVTMRTEFVSLGHEAHYFWYMRWLPETYEKAMTSGDGTKIGMIMTLPRHIHGDIKLVDDWEKSDEPAVVFAMDVETAVDYVDKMITLGDFVQVDPGAPSLDDIRHIGGLTFVMARTRHGEIGFSLPGTVPDPQPESIDTLVRFASVFDLAYSRFEDLKKAELRNRETQIELALERSRNQSMLMQHSDELNKTARVFHEQLDLLGIGSEFSYLWLPDESKMQHLFWATWHESVKGETIYNNKEVIYPLDKTEPSIAACYVAWESGERVHINPVPPEGVEDYFATWDELLHGVDKFKPELFPDGIYYVDAYMKYGCFGIMIKRLITDDERKILGRFAVEFERAYTRFLDLKKSEAQVREAQIEASLERVRSKTIAMHNSHDMGIAVETLFDQVLKLGLDKDIRCGIGILEGKERMETRSATLDQYGEVDLRMGMLDMTIHPMLKRIKKAWGSVGTRYTDEMTGQDVVRYYTALNNEPDYPFHRNLNTLPKKEFHNSFSFSEGILFAFSPNPMSDEAAKVMDRFARVFGQTYRRYLDLRKAEAQAREANVETALERVRARALAMQKPEELKDVAKVLRREMGLLGVEELETCSIYINDVSAEKAECWYALKDIRKGGRNLLTDHFALNLNDTWVGRKMLKFYDSADNKVSILMRGANRKEWIKYCETKSAPFRGYYGEAIPDRTYHLYKFSHGAIGAAAAGDISEESWRLLRRAASVFSLAYSRFNDLTKARHDLIKLKEEKKRAENALTELRSTQSQLIHAEKMASLGELTAGIAHEIQNPLNFVNNFSEVNSELIAELNEEIQNGNLEEIKAIAKDIAGNEQKIMHHGKRAEAIVKGMLQHSRGSNKDKQETDLNTLADEYLRLSYHGLRAKNKSFNADFKLNADSKLPKANVVAQDIGRVLLNLINNAFYAVSEKAKQKKQGYKPTVVVSTKKLNGNIEISVKDNGDGIPKKILDKIFQPFFTTKPTGEGTGLGLSMSYDIITKGHGGELKVETKEGEFTAFIIVLPK